MTEFLPLLAELETAANARNPGWSAVLAPGLSRERIDEILAPLGAWRPPEEVLALYEWHNGQPGPDEHGLWVPFQWCPLEEAVETLQEFRRTFPQWPPLLAIGYGSKASLEVPLSRRRIASQPLYVRNYEGPPFRAFNGLKGLLLASLEAYRSGVFRWSDEFAYWEDGSEDERDQRRHEIRLRFNRGASPTLWDEQEELGRHWINPQDASTWPTAWQAFIGFSERAFKPVGATATITDVVVGRVDWSRPVVIRGTVDGMLPTENFRVTLSDGTQFLQVLCKGALSTGVAIGDHFEFSLERPLDAAERAQIAGEDEAFDRAMRKQLRGVMDKLEERFTGSRSDADALGVADFFGWDPGKSNLPIFLAKRVALVERIARDDDDDPLVALEEELEDEEAPNLWAGPKPVEVATDVDGLAANVLNGYRTNYRLVQKYAPVDVADLDEFDERLYARVTRVLAKSGFQSLGDWEVANVRKVFPNFPRLAMRSFTDGAGTVCAFYTLHDAGWKAMFPPRKPPVDGILDVVSPFADGRYLLTSSAGDQLKFDAAPLCQRETLPIGSRIEEVLSRHRERVGALTPAGKPIVVRTLEEYLLQARKRHLVERKFHLGRVPTPAELLRLGTNPELADRVHAAMKRIAATIEPGE